MEDCYSMEYGMIILNMFVCILCAYMAGALKCSIDIDRLDNYPIAWYRYAMVVCNLLASLFNMIVVVGMVK